jgi:methyl-accepting chemotaxis protein
VNKIASQPRPGDVRLHHSVFFKATLIVALSAALVTSVMAWTNYAGARNMAISAAKEHAESVSPMIARQISGALRFDKAEQAIAFLNTVVSDAAGDSTGALAVNLEGKVFAQSLAGGNPEALTDAALEALFSGAPFRAVDGFTFSVPVTAGEEGIIYGALASTWVPDRALAGLKHDLLGTLVLTAAIFAAALVGAAFAFHRVIARPLHRVNRAMQRVAAKDYGTGIPERGRRDEIGAIACSLEAFAASLKAADAANEAALMRSAALQAGSTAMMLTDTEMQVVYANAAMVQLMCDHQQAIRRRQPLFDPEKLLGMALQAIMQADAGAAEVPHTLAADALRLAEGATLRHELQFETGSVLVLINRVTDADAAVIGYVAEWRDVTDEKRAAAVVSAIDQSLARAEFSTQGALLSCNARFQALLAPTAGQDLFEVMVLRGGAAGAELSAQLSGGQPVSGLIELARPGRGNAILSGAISPVLNAQRKPQQYVLLGSDVTEAEARQAEAEAQRQALELAQHGVVEALRAALARLSEGDLTAVITAEFSPQYEQLRKDYNIAMGNLQQAMRSVVENAIAIRAEAGEITTAADDLSRRTEQQAAALEQTAAALNQLTASVKSAADVAGQANQMVTTAKADAETSGKVVRDAILAMGEIEDSSVKISRITSVIDEIAFQTNLLALNAGVEAARAGEAGRGFAVVASEVRALAQRSSDAAKEIAGLISSSSTHVKRGVGLVGQAGDALGGIEKSVADIHNFVAEIAVSARQQSSGLAEINIAVTKLDQVTQQNAAMFEQTTAASHSLTQEAETLSATVAQFHIDRAEIESGQGTVTAFQSSRKRGPTEMTTAASPTTGSARNSAGPRQWRPKRQAETHGATALADEADADLAGWEDF